MWYIKNLLQALWECVYLKKHVNALRFSGLQPWAAYLASFIASICILWLCLIGRDVFRRKKATRDIDAHWEGGDDEDFQDTESILYGTNRLSLVVGETRSYAICVNGPMNEKMLYSEVMAVVQNNGIDPFTALVGVAVLKTDLLAMNPDIQEMLVDNGLLFTTNINSLLVTAEEVGIAYVNEIDALIKNGTLPEVNQNQDWASQLIEEARK